MVIFKSFENFCGFLYFLMIVVWILGIIAVMIICRSDEPEETEEDTQAFIDGIEFAIDNGWDFPDEDFEEYKRLTKES